MNESCIADSIRDGRKRISKICIMFVVAAVISYLAVMMLFRLVSKSGMHSRYIVWAAMSVNALLPVFTALIFSLLTARLAPGVKYACESMTPRRFFMFFAEMLPITFIGSIMGSSVSGLIGDLFSVDMPDTVSELIESISIPAIIVFTVILAPIFEEICFRKILIDKLSEYGTSFCVVFSGLAFGAYHGNFYQFFYAFAIGMLFAYIYCRYGKIRYTIFLHMILNFLGSVAAVTVSDFLQSEIMWKQTAASVYALFYLAVFIIGIVFLVKDVRIRYFRCFPGKYASPFKVLFPTAGFLIFVIFSICLFIVAAVE